MAARDAFGLAGVLLVLAGIRLLWQARHEAFYWAERFARLFRSRLVEPSAAGPVDPPPARRARQTLLLIVGTGFLFFLGPALIALGLFLG